tara:strand:- start:47 stop:547 length:501 start_codon:yes stop_codon:yes gene_type:complete
MHYQSKNFFSTSLFLLVGIILVVAPTAPTNLNIKTYANLYPDLVTCLIFALIINSPKLFPAPAVLILCLLSDLLLMKPIGLYCTLLFLITEIIRGYHRLIIREGFLGHILIFSVCLLVLQGMNILLHKLFFIPLPDFVLVIKQLFLTIIFYPVFDLPFKFFLRTQK